jgi:ATP-dependent Clp protease ATP-binding subunit ClpA
VHGVFERFTDEARQVVIAAQEEARALGNTWIGTEHILLGLAGDRGAGAAEVLASFELDVDGLREEVATLVGRGDRTPEGQIPFTPRSKKVLELALREALSLGHNFIAPEHVLLGLVREDEGVAARVLLDHAVTAEPVRERVLARLPLEERRRGGRGRVSFHRARPAPAPGSVHVRPRWEYRTEEGLDLDRLNELGAEGWELAAAVPEGSAVRLVLKRHAPTPFAPTPFAPPPNPDEPAA